MEDVRAKTRLIISYGNPGANFARTKNNAAYIAIDSAVFSAVNIFPGVVMREWQMHTKYLYIITASDPLTIVVKPRTFENRFDSAVRNLYTFYHVEPDNLFLMYPDYALALGKYMVGKETGKGPEKISDVAKNIGTEDFWSVRIGISGAGDVLTDQQYELIRHIGGEIGKEIGIISMKPV